MYTMVLMMAVGGSGDTTAFGGRRASCNGGAYAGCSGTMVSYGCSGSYAGCSGSYAGCYGSYSGCTGTVVSSGGCSGSRRGGFLGGLLGHHRAKKASCQGSGYAPAYGCTGSFGGCQGSFGGGSYSGCTGSLYAPMGYSGGCIGSGYPGGMSTGCTGGMISPMPYMAPTTVVPGTTPAQPMPGMPSGTVPPTTPAPMADPMPAAGTPEKKI